MKDASILKSALLINIRLGWKCLPETLAYYEHLLITKVKSLIKLGLGFDLMKLFKGIIIGATTLRIMTSIITTLNTMTFSKIVNKMRHSK